MKIKIDCANAFIFFVAIVLIACGDFYAKKYYPLANSTTYKNIIGAFSIIGFFVLSVLLLIGLIIKEWWQKKYPPKTNSTDSEVIDNNPPKDGNITE